MADIVALLCVGAIFGVLALSVAIWLYGVRGWRWLAADLREWLNGR